MLVSRRECAPLRRDEKVVAQPRLEATRRPVATNTAHELPLRSKAALPLLQLAHGKRKITKHALKLKGRMWLARGWRLRVGDEGVTKIMEPLKWRECPPSGWESRVRLGGGARLFRREELVVLWE